jgi:hypothetical protein
MAPNVHITDCCLTNEDLTQIFTNVAMIGLDRIVSKDFSSFGMMNSHIYRSKLEALMQVKLPNVETRMIMICLFCVISSKARVQNELNADQFKDIPDLNNLKSFVANSMVQHTSELKGKPAGKYFAAVHVASSYPFVAAYAVIKLKRIKSVQAFLRHLWAAQLYLDADMQKWQKAWEKTFWNDQVKKGSAAYIKGFQEEFYDTKSMDKYPLINKEGKIWKPNNQHKGGYMHGDIHSYICYVSGLSERDVVDEFARDAESG